MRGSSLQEPLPTSWGIYITCITSNMSDKSQAQHYGFSPLSDTFTNLLPANTSNQTLKGCLVSKCNTGMLWNMPHSAIRMSTFCCAFLSAQQVITFIREQLGVRILNMNIWHRTTNLLISRWPALPAELQPPLVILPIIQHTGFPFMKVFKGKDCTKYWFWKLLCS